MTAEVAAEPALARVVNVRDARRGTYTYIGRGSEWATRTPTARANTPT